MTIKDRTPRRAGGFRARIAAGLGDRQARSLGQSLVELAIVTPLILIIFAGAVDLGRAFYAYVAIENAAKEGAFFGAQKPLCDDPGPGCAFPNNVRDRVRLEAPNLRNPDGTPLTPTVQCFAPNGTLRSPLTTCEEGDTYLVSVAYQFRFITPLLGNVLGSDLTLATESKATVLNLAFDPTPGVSVQKLVQAAGARNGAEVIAKCTEPDDFDSAGFYRSPCRDTTNGNADLSLRYRTGDVITYKMTIGNSGATNLTGVTVTDSQGWPSGCPTPPSSMAIGSPFYTCTYQRNAPTVSGSVDEMDYVNVLTASSNETSPARDDVTVLVERPPAEFQVFKYVSPYQEGDDGDGSKGGLPSFGTDTSITVSRSTLITPHVWFKIIVRNTGGRSATGVSVTDSRGPLPYGQNNANAICDPQPSSIAGGASFQCRYRVTFGSNGTTDNTVSATASNVTPDSGDTATATVTTNTCSLPDQVIPSLIGRTRTQAELDWPLAGFTGTLTTWSGQPNNTVKAQSRQAFSCLPSSTTMTVYRDPTP